VIILAKIEVKNITHRFEGKGERTVVALQDLSLHVEEGEFVTIVGPSGCGKSTLFNITAGLLQPSEGEVYVDGTVLNGINDQVAYMFQRDLLLDWRSVLDNIIFGAEILGVPKEKARKEALDWIERFGLQGFEDSYPYALSGGMRQRAALLRTLLTHRDVLLLDEPFGSLDAQTRTIMQEFLMSLWDDLDRTVLFVTHDVDEAVLLADRLYVMTARPGTIKAELAVQLPRPRNYEVLSSDGFFSIKTKVLDLIHEESLKAEPAVGRGE
jgi:ABC-type nitrate/sulfonate/bicarbonate transport system ATPase subunit